MALLVQSAQSSSGDFSHQVVLPMPAPAAPGDLILVAMGKIGTSSASGLAVTDNYGNTYTNHFTADGVGSITMWTAVAVTGSGDWKIYGDQTLGGGQALSLIGAEFSGAPVPLVFLNLSDNNIDWFSAYEKTVIVPAPVSVDLFVQSISSVVIFQAFGIQTGFGGVTMSSFTPEGAATVIQTIPVPVNNPFLSVIMYTDFLEVDLPSLGPFPVGVSYVSGTSAGDQPHSGFICIGVVAISLTCPTSSAQVAIAYSSSFTVVGGTAPYTFSIIAGALPPGLTLNASTGLVSGTPTSAGPYSYTGQVQDVNGLTATASCAITVTGGITLACPAINVLTVGIPYSGALTVTGGTPPFTFLIVLGMLPPGLSLDNTTGVISGTPTAAGTYSYTAQVIDSFSQTARASCSFLVITAPVSNCPPTVVVSGCTPIR